ncbi:MAG: glycosyltransferase family 1 protein [Ahniella sp.]|nr:glycosyltransferase family 1 protein [Ahniella sp.]
MRIAIVTETYPPEINGVALTVHNMVVELRALGHTVDLSRPRQPGEAESGTDVQDGARLLSGSGLPRYPGLRFGWPATNVLRAAWQQAGIDAVYVATEGPLGWSGVRAARSLGLPVFTGFHTRFDDFVAHYGASWLVPVAQAWLRRFHNRATATLVPTRALKKELDERGFRRVERLARGVDTRLFSPQRRDQSLRTQWGVPADGLAVIHVGRFAAEKNLGLAVRAFRAIQGVVPEARFVWIGDGPERAALMRDNPDFVFMGMQRDENLAKCFASGDVFLFPSLTETFGNVTVEALASGVPTIAFDYGAAQEHIKHETNGLVAAFGDEEDFIQHALLLAGSRERRQLLSMRARETVAPLSQRAVAQQLIELAARELAMREAA